MLEADDWTQGTGFQTGRVLRLRDAPGHVPDVRRRGGSGARGPRQEPRGDDAVLRDEYVVLSAHMDYICVAGGATGCAARGADSICNGADDNASGTAMVMTIG